MSPVRISVVIISYNRCDDLRLVLESVRASQYPNLEVVVVDNASKDGSVEVASGFPGVKVIRNSENLGFAEANNQALGVATGAYIALVNNDAVLSPEWLHRLSGFLDEHPEVAAVGGKAYLWDEQNPLWNRNNRYYSHTLVDPRTGVTHATMDTPDDALEVATLSGCAVMIRRSAIDSVGGPFLDPLFFTYYEETDFFARCIRGGWRIYYLGEAAVWHRVRASTEKMPYHYFFHMERNRILYVFKNFEEAEFRRSRKRLYRTLMGKALGHVFRLFRHKSVEARGKWDAWMWCFRNRRRMSKLREEQGLTGSSYNTMVREIQAQGGYYGHSRPEVVKHVPEGTRVMIDIGCGSGALGKAVKQKLGDVQVFGVEISARAVAMAKQVLDGVRQGGAEEVVTDIWPDADCLVFADVLEHLVDPWSVLAGWVQRLPAGGTVILSLPNVTHGSVLRGLIRGRWTYMNAGILDRTHLRFFTRSSAILLLQGAGLELQRIERVIEAPFPGSLGRKWARWARWAQSREPLLGSTGLSRFLLDAGTVQFILVGICKTGKP